MCLSNCKRYCCLWAWVRYLSFPSDGLSFFQDRTRKWYQCRAENSVPANVSPEPETFVFVVWCGYHNTAFLVNIIYHHFFIYFNFTDYVCVCVLMKLINSGTLSLILTFSSLKSCVFNNSVSLKENNFCIMTYNIFFLRGQIKIIAVFRMNHSILLHQ